MRNQLRSFSNAHRGMTLVEVVLAIVFLGLIVVGGTAAFAPWARFKERADTEGRLDRLRVAMHEVYSRSSWYITAGSTVRFLDAVGNLTDSLVPVTGCADIENTGAVDTATTMGSSSTRLSPIIVASNLGVAAATTDGFGNPFCFLFSEPQVTKAYGATMVYRDFHFLSCGENRICESTYYPATNVWVLGGDDLLSSVSGDAIVREKYATLRAKLDRIVAAIENYHASRFQMEPVREMARKNLFCHDFETPPNNFCTAMSGNAILYFNSEPGSDSIRELLGLQISDVTSPWEPATNEEPSVAQQIRNVAFALRLDNFVRSGLGAAADPPATRTPPYSMIIGVPLPVPASALQAGELPLMLAPAMGVL